MSFIRKIRDSLGEARLRRKTGSIARKKAFINFAQAKTIAIIFDSTNVDHLELVKKYVSDLKEKKKTVKAIGYFDQKFTPVNISYAKSEFDFFNQKELTRLNQPASPYIRTFIEEPHDVFIDLNIQNKFPLRSIALQSRASFKIGVDIPANQQVHDLLISVKPEEGLVRYLTQVEKYFEMINRTSA